jgi:hypothetical protein
LLALLRSFLGGFTSIAALANEKAVVLGSVRRQRRGEFAVSDWSERVWDIAAVGLLEPGRKRRGRTTAFWLWFFAGLLAGLIVLGVLLSLW